MHRTAILAALAATLMTSAGCERDLVAPVGPGMAAGAAAGERTPDGARGFRNPIAAILAAPALGLTDDQVARLTEIERRLEAENAPVRERLRATVGDPISRRGGASGGNAPDRETRRATMAQVRPLMEQLRQNSVAALEEARAVLTADQLSGLRERVRQRAERPERAAPSGGRSFAAGDPVTRVLARQGDLALTPDQVTALTAIGDRLRAQNDPLREQVQAIRGDSGPGPRRGQGPPSAAEREEIRVRMEQARPRVERMRQNASAAAEEIRNVLTAEQQASLQERRVGARAGRPGQGRGQGSRGGPGAP